MTTLYEWLVFLHTVAAMIWVGGGVLLGGMAIALLRTNKPDAVVWFVRILPVIGPRVLAPATVVVFGAGILLVLSSIGWAFGQLWIQLGLAPLFAAAFVVGAAHQSRAATGAERAIDRGDHDEAHRHLTRWSWGYGVIVLLLLAASWDMMFKPGL
jgi:uncharacterized membrane protein